MIFEFPEEMTDIEVMHGYFKSLKDVGQILDFKKNSDGSYSIQFCQKVSIKEITVTLDLDRYLRLEELSK